ncbi:MAG: Nudix hydrolase family protein [Candidatus Ozemobacter sibiricus]|jgi:8-oxo-dGTP pyrophosphatase MutT (NUDIX family)|uniref:Nudix hydrolase family protein n=1 Tax=Candidatus Ozemobacter sibiricus TaxID=2268124 RepID=A0A367ZBS8_9BACT|nr:MAG: Nudix hydrolase family protein [Candidatus Ozemobacter sibiricus]
MIVPAPYHRLVARALLHRDGELLLVRQRSLRSGRPFWTLPGGLVEPDETLAEAVRRELREETGLDADPLGVVALQELPHVNLLEVVLLCQHPRGSLRTGFDPELADPHRILEVRWFPLAALPPCQPAPLLAALLQQGIDSLPRLPLPHRLALD